MKSYVYTTMLLVAVIVFGFCSPEDTYHIKALSNATCDNAQPCITLSDFAQQNSIPAKRTILKFMPGEHMLSSNISVANSNSYSLIGLRKGIKDEKSRIKCEENVGFTFSNMRYIRIHHLVFTSCGIHRIVGIDDVMYNPPRAITQMFALFMDSILQIDIINSTFENNTGTALGVNNSRLPLDGNNSFLSNCRSCSNISSCSCRGGGLYSSNSSLMFRGYSSFVHNVAEEGGGIYVKSSTLEVYGHIIFNNNVANDDCGGGISIHSSILEMFSTSNTVLENNTAFCGGGIEAVNSDLIFSGNSTFENNSANWGGGIFANISAVLLHGVSYMVNNTARVEGGGIYLKYSTITSEVIGDISFIANFASEKGRGIYSEFSSVNFTGNVTFNRNCAQVYGGGIYARGSKVYLLESTFCFNHAVLAGGSIYSGNTTVSFTANNLFASNSAGAYGGAVSLHASTLNFSSTNTTFKNNTSNKGGGIYLCYKSFWTLLQDTRVLMTKNTAAYRGGAIYSEDTNYNIYCLPDQLRREVIKNNNDGLYNCFFQRSNYSRNVKIIFESNSAQEAGNALYGGLVDNCKLNDPQDSSYAIQTSRVFNKTFSFTQSSSNFSAVSSFPFKVCPCQNNYPDCETSAVNRQVYPGEKITLSVVAVGQRNGTAAAVIRSYVQSDKLGELQESQSVYQHCTNLFYTVPWASTLKQEILLYVEGLCSKEGNSLSLYLELLPCPIGFNLSKERVCECEPRLQMYTNSCNVTEQSVQHNGDFWVGYSNESGGLILHPHCPFDYCMSGSVQFTFNDTDKQCKHNRSGLLCGRCKHGLSLTFATSQCTECSSDINLLLLLAFALAGLALVFFLLIFRITVAAGTLNGLIVYANILSLNSNVLLSKNSANFLTVFIAWLNLDFGIPLCFYNGMDAYARTWLQFVFPVYIWLVIGLIILLSNISQRMAKVFGTNPVAVLATLFLLSYVKILRTIITAVSLTFLEYPDQNKAVWLHDANIGYLEGKHIPLFLAAVFMFLTFFLPYTIILLLGQCFQAKSHMWLFSWANNSRLKAFMDAYHAPYKPRHRYWTGLLLVICSIMFLTLGFNPNSDPSVTLLLVILTAVVIHSWAWVVGGVYKNWWLEMLESSFILNLGIMAAVTYKLQLENCEDRLGVSLKLGGRNQTAAYVSLSIAFVTTTVIFAYHIYLQIQNMQPCKICSKLFSKEAKALSNYLLSTSLQESVNESNGESPQDNTPVPSSSYIQLRETLLESKY